MIPEAELTRLNTIVMAARRHNADSADRAAFSMEAKPEKMLELLVEIDRLKGLLAVVPDGVAHWQIVEKLRAPEGHAVTLICDNPDFNGQPNCAVECCADWTDWKPHRFTGDTILEALQAALAAATRADSNKPLDRQMRALGLREKH